MRAGQRDLAVGLPRRRSRPSRLLDSRQSSSRAKGPISRQGWAAPCQLRWRASGPWPRREDVVVAALGIVAMSLLLVYAATIGVHVQRHNDFYKEVWPVLSGAGRRPPRRFHPHRSGVRRLGRAAGAVRDDPNDLGRRSTAGLLRRRAAGRHRCADLRDLAGSSADAPRRLASADRTDAPLPAQSGGAAVDLLRPPRGDSRRGAMRRRRRAGRERGDRVGRGGDRTGFDQQGVGPGGGAGRACRDAGAPRARRDHHRRHGGAGADPRSPRCERRDHPAAAWRSAPVSARSSTPRSCSGGLASTHGSRPTRGR